MTINEGQHAFIYVRELRHFEVESWEIHEIPVNSLTWSF